MPQECPVVNYGIPDDGADEYNIQSGREMFRCGLDCVKLYIVNVALEKTRVKHNCDSIADAVAGSVCLQSVNVQWKDQNVVNWIGKTGVDSSYANGTVINKARDCAGTTSIYTHSEGNLSGRVLTNVEQLKNSFEEVRDQALTKLRSVGTFTDRVAELDNLEWVFSDMSVNVSPTDWQGGSITFQGFGRLDAGSTRSYRANFNWQNGRQEEGSGMTTYDITDTPALLDTIITALI